MLVHMKVICVQGKPCFVLGLFFCLFFFFGCCFLNYISAILRKFYYFLQFDELSKPIGQECEFIFIRLNVLREYLERELRMDGLPFEYDFEVSTHHL